MVQKCKEQVGFGQRKFHPDIEGFFSFIEIFLLRKLSSSAKFHQFYIKNCMNISVFSKILTEFREKFYFLREKLSLFFSEFFRKRTKIKPE